MDVAIDISKRILDMFMKKKEVFAVFHKGANKVFRGVP